MKFLKKLSRRFLILAPMAFSRIPAVQRYIHRNVGGTVHSSAIIHFSFLENLARNGSFGGITIGSNVKIKNGVRIQSNWKLYDRHSGEPIFNSGDIVLGREVKINSNIIIHPGTYIPPKSIINKQEEADHYKGRLLKNGEKNETQLIELKQYSPIFILGTGRSGTKALTNLYLQSGRSSRHEIHPWLNAIGYAKHLNPGKRFTIDLAIRWGTFYSNNRQVIDSDQRFFNLTPELIELFPKGKFLHVIRSAKGFVQSAKARGWYLTPEPQIHRWAYYRPSPVDVKLKCWEGLSQADRILWYWYYVNDTILRGLSELKHFRKKTIWLESSNFSQEALDFLEAPRQNIPKTNTSEQNQIKKSPLTKEEEKLCANTEKLFRQRWGI